MKTVLSILVILALTVTGLSIAASVTERKDSQNKYTAFYEQEADFDVLFIGQSRMLNTVFPMELWRDYGIVSYNLAGHGNRIPTNYWLLLNALEYTTPKLVVLDCGLMKEEGKVGTIEQLHLSMDHIPMSATKAAMVEDLLGDSPQKMDFLWKFSTYHNRWNEVTGADIAPVINMEKGAESRVGVASPAAHQDFGREEVLQEEGVGAQYLRKILDECQERGIEVLLTYVPFPDPTGWQVESNSVWPIAEEYGVDYLDFHTLLPKVNLWTDCHDPDAHLNPSGGWKITDYLGEYITSHYPVEDQRENPLYADWTDAYAEYQEFKWNRLRQERDLKNYLSLLYDRDVSFAIWMKPRSEWLKSSSLQQVLANIAVDTAIWEYDDYLVVIDRKDEESHLMRINESKSTGVGEVGLRINFDTAAMIFDHNGEEYQMDRGAQAGILVWDAETGEVVDFSQFTVDAVTSQRTQ